MSFEEKLKEMVKLKDEIPVPQDNGPKPAHMMM